MLKGPQQNFVAHCHPSAFLFIFTALRETPRYTLGLIVRLEPRGVTLFCRYTDTSARASGPATSDRVFAERFYLVLARQRALS